MRTSKKIRNGLECCKNGECEDCRYLIGSGSWSCVGRLIKDVFAYVEQLEAQQLRWISVKERLPDKCGYYLVACEGEDIPHVLYFRGKTWAVSQSHYHVPEYWMEIPKPSKEE